MVVQLKSLVVHRDIKPSRVLGVPIKNNRVNNILSPIVKQLLRNAAVAGAVALYNILYLIRAYPHGATVRNANVFFQTLKNGHDMQKTTGLLFVLKTMESLISTLKSARHAGCQNTDQFAAYAAAKWECSVSQARTQLPPFEAYLHRVDRNNVLLSLTCHDPTQILGWDKVVLVRDCGETIKNNPVMHAACNSVVPALLDTVHNRVIFELMTHDNSVTIDHGETQMDSDVRASCVRHVQNSSNAVHSDNQNTQNGTDGAHALLMAIESASSYQRTHVVVFVADRYRNVNWEEIRAAKQSGASYVYITALTIGNRAQDMMPIADNIVHWCTDEDPCQSTFTDAMIHANSHVSTGLCMSIRTSCSEKPYFGCQTLPSVRRNTPHAKTIIGGCLAELLSNEKQGVEEFLRRETTLAAEKGVHWCGSRMVIRNENLRQWVPVVDTSRTQWQTYTRKVPLVYKVTFHTILRMNGDSNSQVTLRMENGHNARTVTLKATRARTITRVGMSHDAVGEARWCAYMQYIQDCIKDFNTRHLDELISRAPTHRERRAWMVQKRLIQEGELEKACRIRDHASMIRLHNIQ